VIISTASEHVRGYAVKLTSVSLGGIRQRNVEAMVIDGDHPGPILLGMSFLDKLSVEKDGRTMTLRQRQ
jgi:aspartyl protease family protein